MKLNVATAETPLLARKDGAAPAKTRRLAHILIACALAIAAIVGTLYVHGGAPLPFARSASGSDVDVAGEDGTSTDAKTKTKTTTTTRGGSRGGAKKPNKPLKRIYLPRRDQTYEDPDGGELPDGVDVETVLCGRCGETASRTTSFAKCTPFLKDFGLSPPALSFRRSFYRRDVRLTPTRRRFNPTRRRRRRG